MAIKQLKNVSNIKNCNVVIIQQNMNKKFINLFKKINFRW